MIRPRGPLSTHSMRDEDSQRRATLKSVRRFRGMDFKLKPDYGANQLH